MIEYKRAGDNKFPWQVISIGLSVLLAILAAGKTWFINDYRLEQLEKQVIMLDVKLDRQDEKLAKLQSTYDLLIGQARDHGWDIPWQRGRRH